MTGERDGAENSQQNLVYGEASLPIFDFIIETILWALVINVIDGLRRPVKRLGGKPTRRFWFFPYFKR